MAQNEIQKVETKTTAPDLVELGRVEKAEPMGGSETEAGPEAKVGREVSSALGRLAEMRNQASHAAQYAELLKNGAKPVASVEQILQYAGVSGSDVSAKLKAQLETSRKEGYDTMVASSIEPYDSRTAITVQLKKSSDLGAPARQLSTWLVEGNNGGDDFAPANRGEIIEKNLEATSAQHEGEKLENPAVKKFAELKNIPLTSGGRELTPQESEVIAELKKWGEKKRRSYVQRNAG